MIDVNLPPASLTSGLLIGDGRQAALTFDVDGQALNLVVSTEQLVALMGLCNALASQAQAARPEELVVVPVADWNVATTSGGSVLLRLASDAGAALCYHLGREQAFDVQDAMGRAVAAASRSEAARERQDAGEETPSANLDALDALRGQCDSDPSTLALISRCADFLAQLDAANDEGRDILQENTAAFVDAVKQRLLNLDASPGV